MKMTITTRLTLIKNILVISMLSTMAFTWRLWWPVRTFPLLPEAESLVNIPVLGYVLPIMLIVSLLFAFLFRKPRVFIFLALIAFATLLLLDAGRVHYWSYLYLLFFLLLFGYNWRVDDAHYYTSVFNGIRLALAGIYIVAAVQHFNSEFFQHQWMQFIKPFERFWTPEQCSYLAKIAYGVPFVELFIAAGLFLYPTRIAAIVFAILFHVFSFTVFLLQDQIHAAVLIWHVSMMLLILVSFAGNTKAGTAPGFAFEFYPASVLLLAGILTPVYFSVQAPTIDNKPELMRSNNYSQYVYLRANEKEKLPLYVQSFALQREKGLNKLCVTQWMLNETGTRVMLSADALVKFTASLNETYHADALVAIPGESKTNGVIALK